MKINKEKQAVIEIDQMKKYYAKLTTVDQYI